MRRILPPRKESKSEKQKRIAADVARHQVILDESKAEEKIVAASIVRLNGDVKKSEVAKVEADKKLDIVKDEIKDKSLEYNQLDSDVSNKSKEVKEIDAVIKKRNEFTEKVLKESKAKIAGANKRAEANLEALESRFTDIKYDYDLMRKNKDDIRIEVEAQQVALIRLTNESTMIKQESVRVAQVMGEEYKQILKLKEKRELEIAALDGAREQKGAILKRIEELDKEINVKSHEFEDMGEEREDLDLRKLAMLKRETRIKNLAADIEKYYAKAGININIDK